MEVPFIEKFNWVDFLVLVFLLRGGYLGFTKGSAWGIARFIGILLVTVTAFCKSYPLAQWAQERFAIHSPFLEWVFFILLGIVLISLVNFCIGIVTKLLALAPEGWIGRAAGTVLGCVQASVLVSLLLVTLVMSTSTYLNHHVKRRSFLGMGVMQISISLYMGFKEYVPGEGQLSPQSFRQITEKST